MLPAHASVAASLSVRVEAFVSESAAQTRPPMPCDVLSNSSRPLTACCLLSLAAPGDGQAHRSPVQPAPGNKVCQGARASIQRSSLLALSRPTVQPHPAAVIADLVCMQACNCHSANHSRHSAHTAEAGMMRQRAAGTCGGGATQHTAHACECIHSRVAFRMWTNSLPHRGKAVLSHAPAPVCVRMQHTQCRHCMAGTLLPRLFSCRQLLPSSSFCHAAASA